jgi:hypothetical protein
MEAMLLELLGRNANSPANSGGMVGPGIVVIGGARLNLEAPIRADWIPSMTDRELTQFGTHGSEPSNGTRFGKPLRSPAGYPLHYTPDGFGGTRGAQVYYDGVGFPDDAAIEAFKVAVRQRDANLDRVGGRFSPSR